MITFASRVVVLVGIAWTTPIAFAEPASVAPPGPLSPEAIVAKHITGKATVEFTVDEVYLLPATWAASSDFGWKVAPLNVVPKNVGKKGSFYQMSVIVSGHVALRLRQLGIENPAEHFRGKVLRVSGTVTSMEKRAGTFYRLEVTSLGQLEVIRRP